MTAGTMRFAGKRVAMVTFSPYPFDSRPRRAVDALVGEGASVDLICIGEGSEPTRETLNGLSVLRLPINHNRAGIFTYVYRYAAFILASSVIFALRSIARRYDLVYVHNMPDILVLSSVIPKALGAKVVLDLHDPMPELMTTVFNLDKNSFSVRCIRRMEKWSIARANLIVTVNLACKRIFSARSCKPEKIAVVMNVPDPKLFPFHAVNEQSSTQRAPTQPFVMMYQGTLVERNGLDLAVEALALMREKMPTAELRVYGPSTPFLERVMEMVQARGMQDIVHYLGPRRLEDLVCEIEGCDVGVIPNQQNPFNDINTPTRIFEYLAMGKPAIAPNTLGIKDYFNQESLVFFEPGNAVDLAKQMAYTYCHRNELAGLVHRGQQIYLEHPWEVERETLLGGVSKILN
jgi:glycosyltransferase involved in cell wall biosynthesis